MAPKSQAAAKPKTPKTKAATVPTVQKVEPAKVDPLEGAESDDGNEFKFMSVQAGSNDSFCLVRQDA